MAKYWFMNGGYMPKQERPVLENLTGCALVIPPIAPEPRLLGLQIRLDRRMPREWIGIVRNG